MNEKNHAQTILTIVVGLVGLGLFFKINWLLLTAFGIGILCILWPILAQKIAQGWLWIGKWLGYINGSILLSVVFFVFLTPIAFVMRLLAKKDELLLKKPEKSSFFDRNKTFTKEDLENTW
jgi:hypothetical protein